jgi:hypothetical protein
VAALAAIIFARASSIRASAERAREARKEADRLAFSDLHQLRIGLYENCKKFASLRVWKSRLFY